MNKGVSGRFFAHIKNGVVKSPSISDYNLELLRLICSRFLYGAAFDKTDLIDVFHVIVVYT